MVTRAPRAPRVAPETRRAEILEAALRCFGEQGYARTTVDLIAARAGVSKGAIYWYFPDGKRAVVLALLDHILEGVTRAWDALAGEGPADQVLAGMLEAGRRATQDGLPLMSLEFLTHVGGDIDLRRRFTDVSRSVSAPFAREVARGIEAGIFRDVDPEHAALAILAALSGLKLHKAMRPELDLDRAWRVTQELWLEGLRA